MLFASRQLISPGQRLVFAVMELSVESYEASRF